MKSEFPLPSMAKDVPMIPAALRTQRGAVQYKNLILVGHSTGAVIIRQAILLHLEKVRETTTDLKSWIAEQQKPGAPQFGDQLIAKASLHFFAPAHLGVLAAGRLGLASSLPIVSRICEAFLRCNPLYQSLNWGNCPTLLEIKRETETLYRDHEVGALKAFCLFGTNEEIVTVGGYSDDEVLPTEDGQSHTSVCKPNHNYLKPLEFVTDAQRLAKRARETGSSTAS